MEQSSTLLDRMAQKPDEVLEALEPEERAEVMEELSVLNERATKARTASELQLLTNDVLRLVVKRSTLKERFPVTLRRSGSRDDINNILSEMKVLEYADQIANSVERLGQAIGEELERIPDPKGHDDRG